MTWVQLDILMPRNRQGTVVSLLDGILGTSCLRQEETKDQKCIVKALLPLDKNLEGLLKKIDHELSCLDSGPEAGGSIEVDLKMVDSLRTVGTDSTLRPKALSRRVSLTPPGDDRETTRGGSVLTITANRAFGDGTHPSTRLALKLIDSLLEGTYGPVVPENGWILDLGCGTAVLALAVAVLGDFNVLALDISEAAMVEAKRNLHLNPDMAGKVHLIHGDQRCCGKAFSVVLANLVTAVHLQVADTLWQLVAPGGWLVLSGFTAKQYDLVLAPHLTRGAKKTADAIEKGWAAQLLQKI